ncbi:recombinase family protein [Rubellimicrobium rubrum]|uniref:recombinase family protein n=1 Tax=Rubellimicrobium rubrum TaxID=2585369 RepID=UPI001FE5A21F|nr:recombinase family protein [Rubellimicrobium rubrum]
MVVVTKYDRLARSLKDLLEIVDAIQTKGAGFRSLAEDIDTTTPAGRLVFHVFASIAQFERERISERTREGIEAASGAPNDHLNLHRCHWCLLVKSWRRSSKNSRRFWLS